MAVDQAAQRVALASVDILIGVCGANPHVVDDLWACSIETYVPGCKNYFAGRLIGSKIICNVM